MPTTYSNVSSASALSADIKAIDLASQASSETVGVNYVITLAPNATLTEAADIDAVSLNSKDTLTINGQGAALNGADAYRGLFAYAGNLTIKNLTIENAVAKGGDGANGGGGGAGLGGGLFIADNSAPANVTLDNVVFSKDSAVGGDSSTMLTDGGGGGGGLGGNGGASSGGGSYGGGGGGGGVGGNGGGAGDPGGAGLIPGASAGARGAFSGGNGGASGGGGGGGSITRKYGASGGGGGIGAADNGSGIPGIGGFGGGGGGSGNISSSSGTGGFGGGGGGGSAGRPGGFGGGAGAGAFSFERNGGFGGGNAASGGGGGGLGAGGDIFVMTGASLTIEGGSLSGGSVAAGLGANGGQNGQALGSGIFLQGEQGKTIADVTFAPAAGATETISDVIDDPTGSGAGQVIFAGAGALALDAANTFTGGVAINGSGTLLLGNSAGAGSGAIAFASSAVATLLLAGGVDPKNVIDGLDANDNIDLQGFGGGTLARVSGDTLTISYGAATDIFNLDPGQTYSISQFHIAPDSKGGSEIWSLAPGALSGPLTVSTAVAHAPILDAIPGLQVEIEDKSANIQSDKAALNSLIAAGHVFSLTTIGVTGQPYNSYTYLYDASGELTLKDFAYFPTNEPYANYVYSYSPGNDFVGSKFDYFGAMGAPYIGYEYDYDGGGAVTRIAYSGVSGAAYSSYEYDYIGGVFAGSKFTVTAVPSGAAYSSYELDYNQANAFTGDKFFFTNIAGQSYTGEEVDYDANGKLSRVLLSGVTDAAGQAYASLEEDYSAGVYTGYKAYYSGISGQPFVGEEVDASAAGQLEKVVYTGMSTTPYQSIEQDYSGGVLADTIYDFTKVAGASYYAYQVEENAQGVLMQTTYDLNNGGHAIVGARNGLTLTSLGDDGMTGGGSSETFVFNPIFGADKISDFAAHDSGAGHDTISLSKADFSDFAAVTAAAMNVGSNLAIKAADGDTLTLIGLNTTALAGLSADFAFHG